MILKCSKVLIEKNKASVEFIEEKGRKEDKIFISTFLQLLTERENFKYFSPGSNYEISFKEIKDKK